MGKNRRVVDIFGESGYVNILPHHQGTSDLTSDHRSIAAASVIGGEIAG